MCIVTWLGVGLGFGFGFMLGLGLGLGLGHVYRHLHEDEATHPPVYGDGLVEGEAKQPPPQPVARGRDDDEEAVSGGDVAPRVCDVPGKG